MSDDDNDDDFCLLSLLHAHHQLGPTHQRHPSEISATGFLTSRMTFYTYLQTMNRVNQTAHNDVQGHGALVVIKRERTVKRTSSSRKPAASVH